MTRRSVALSLMAACSFFCGCSRGLSVQRVKGCTGKRSLPN